jgi:hypothetical protein
MNPSGQTYLLVDRLVQFGACDRFASFWHRNGPQCAPYIRAQRNVVNSQCVRARAPQGATRHGPKGDRGTKSKPIPGPHLVYGFLTTATPNAVVEPIHPKAMPVILTMDEERDV